MRRASLLVLATLALAGCGRDRPQPADLRLEVSDRLVPASFPAAGMRLEAPANVPLQKTQAPGVFSGSFGAAFVSAFAYRRAEQLPRNGRELELARKRLGRATEQRSANYALISSRATKVYGARAIELVGDQTISSARLRTRSLHVFKGSAEYVLELAATRSRYAKLNRDLFGPILRTLRLSGRVAGDR